MKTNETTTTTTPKAVKSSLKLKEVPFALLNLNQDNRAGQGIDLGHVAALRASFQASGRSNQIIPVCEAPEGKYDVLDHHHYVWASHEEGFDTFHCEIHPPMNKFARKAFAVNLNTHKRASYLERGNLILEGCGKNRMPQKAFLYLFPDSEEKSALSQISNTLAIWRMAPQRLISALSAGQLADGEFDGLVKKYSEKKAPEANIPEEIYAEIESREKGTKWVKISALLAPKPTPAPAPTTPTEPKAPEAPAVENAPAENNGEASPAPSVPTTPTTQEAPPASVVSISPTDEKVTSAKPNPTESLAPITSATAPDLNRIEADRIINLDSLEKSVGAMLALPSGFERCFDITLKELGELYTVDKVNAEIERQDPPASDEELAKLESTPKSQLNPKAEHPAMINAKAIGKIQTLLKEAMALAPANRPAWLDENCQVREGVVWLKLGSEYCS